MSLADDVTLARHSSEAAPALFDELCDAYADAYGEVPGEDIGVKTAAFRDRATKALERPRYGLVTAHGQDGVAGFVFGYALPTETFWWDGLTPEPPEGFAREDGTRTFVMAEIEVRRNWQSSGIGRALHDEILTGREEERATLATGPSADAARAIYERWGWRRVGTVPGKPGAYFSEYTLYVLPLPLEKRR
jgi:ribosomal protein S18 acetylase RimI-like enzyme